MNKPNTQKGQVIILNTLLFFALSTAIIFALTSPVISSFHITKAFSKSKESFLLANSATSEALYKLNTRKTLSSSETVTLSQGEATIGVADRFEGKTVSVTSDVDSYKRSYELKLVIGSGVSFNYGLQVGQGGFELDGTAEIIGNVYSNGDIVGSNGSRITGSAVSANVSDPVAVVSNTGIVDPLYSIQFGGNTTPEDAAQSFSVSTTTPISSLRMLLKKSGSATMNNITLRIVSDNSGKPSKTTLAQATISAPTITQTFNYISVPLDSNISLTPNVTYWIVLDAVPVAGQYYSVGANDSVYTDGISKTGTWTSSNGGTWNATTPATLDMYIDVYAGGSTGIINNITIGTTGVGDAWSYEVKDSTVEGTIYCEIDSGNNKTPCNTSRGLPVQQAFPISDGNITDWKTEAIDAGSTTTRSYGGGTYELGPIWIDGDLSVGSGAVLNLNGTVYVKGNISVTGNGLIKVNPALNNKTVVLLTDGRIQSNGGGQFAGSGASGSYILLITTSTCPTGLGCSGNNAVQINGGSGSVVINAQKGTLEFGGGAEAKQATAYKIIMGANSTVTYESGLSNSVFTSGPSGAWNIHSWKEVE